MNRRLKVRMAVVASSVAVLAAIAPQPAMANHSCALDEWPLLDNLCEGYHESPKLIIQYIAYCLLTDPNHCF
jgi:hypothetical protein